MEKKTRKEHFLKFSEKKSKKSFRLLLYFFEISIFNSFWVSGFSFLMFSIVFRKSKGRKVFTLLFTLYKVKKSKDTTPNCDKHV